MSDISPTARKLFNALPADGRTIGGGKVKDRTGINTHDFKKAKDELKKAGLIGLGRGRGGSLFRLEGAELADEAVEEVADADAMAEVREAKLHKSRAQKERDAMEELILAVAKRNHPEADEIKSGLYGTRWYYEAWEGQKGSSVARIHFLTDEELL